MIIMGWMVFLVAGGVVYNSETYKKAVQIESETAFRSIEQDCFISPHPQTYVRGSWAAGDSFSISFSLIRF
jgi:hypothetical protein